MVYVPSGLFCLVGGRGGVEKSTSPGAERFGGCCASPHTALNLAPTPKGTGGKGERNFITLGGGERVRYFGEYGKQKKEKKEKKKGKKGKAPKGRVLGKPSKTTLQQTIYSARYICI